MIRTAILVDDEPALVEFLHEKLSRLWPELEILGAAHNGKEAIAMANELRPDLLFLDIHMPGQTGLHVAEKVSPETKIVFITAFDRFAVNAFEHAAVDYLLKPVTDDRLRQTIKKLRNISGRENTQVLDLIKNLTGEKQAHLQWIRAGVDTTTELVSVHDIVYFEASEKYTDVATAHKKYVVRMSIKELETQLDPDEFWRVNRGIIVRVSQIESAKRDFRGRYDLKLRDRPEVLRASQRYGRLFRQM